MTKIVNYPQNFMPSTLCYTKREKCAEKVHKKKSLLCMKLPT